MSEEISEVEEIEENDRAAAITEAMKAAETEEAEGEQEETPEETQEVEAGEEEPEIPEHLLKAPETWKPLAREVWDNVPLEAREDIMRREKDIMRGLEETASARRMAEEFGQMMTPYLPMVQAQNTNPLAFVRDTMDTYSALVNGTPEQKATLIASAIQQHQIPIEMLDNILAGGPVQLPQAPPPQQQIDPEAIYRQAQEDARIDAEIEAFAQSHEYFNDVRGEMSDIIGMADARGETLGLEEAYNRAIAMRPDIGTLIERKKQAEEAKRQQEEANKAKEAASSIRSTTSRISTSGEPLSRADAIRAAMRSAL